MRICLVQSSYEGTNSPFEANDPMPDPGIYVNNSVYQFEKRLVRKFAEKVDIDALCAENFDIYMNFMWGQLNDNVAGVEATGYLESKGVTVMVNPSHYMAKTKLDFQEAAKASQTFRVPGNTKGKYPKIVKYVDGMASLGLDEGSLCYSDSEVATRRAIVHATQPSRELIIQDFIRGAECMAIVMEMGTEVVPLAPVEWIFPPNTSVDKAWLTYSNKWDALSAGIIRFAFVTDEPRRSALCHAAVAAFKGLGVQGTGALWGRVDMRVEEGTHDVYCLELNHMPAVFYPKDDKLSDDIIIRQHFPGQHEAFFEMLLFTKQLQMKKAKQHGKKDANGLSNGNGVANGHRASNGHEASNGHQAPNGHEASNGAKFKNHSLRNEHKEDDDRSAQPSFDLSSACPTNNVHSTETDGLKAKGCSIAEVYDSCVDRYDSLQATTAIRALQIDYFAKYDYSGTVLDLACGTGGMGMLIHMAGHDASISGIDLSPLSLQTPQIRAHYTQPLIVGPLQEEIMRYPTSVDHIVCFGALHFLTPTEFIATLARMFMLARKSVAFDVDDVNEEYIDKIVARFGEGLRNYNNLLALRRFGVPCGWRKVFEEEGSLFYSPSVQIDVRGLVLRFEKN